MGHIPGGNPGVHLRVDLGGCIRGSSASGDGNDFHGSMQGSIAIQGFAEGVRLGVCSRCPLRGFAATASPGVHSRFIRRCIRRCIRGYMRASTEGSFGVHSEVHSGLRLKSISAIHTEYQNPFRVLYGEFIRGLFSFCVSPVPRGVSGYPFGGLFGGQSASPFLGQLRGPSGVPSGINPERDLWFLSVNSEIRSYPGVLPGVYWS